MAKTIWEIIANVIFKPESIEERLAHEMLEFFVYGEIYSTLKEKITE